MAWPPPPTIPVEPPIVPGWWTELSYRRTVDRGRAEIRAAEQAKRLRQLRRRVERVDELIVLAQGRAEARQHLRRRGIYERRSEEFGPLEFSPHYGKVLRVRR
jgi:hypothetical protein